MELKDVHDILVQDFYIMQNVTVTGDANVIKVRARIGTKSANVYMDDTDVKVVAFLRHEITGEARLNGQLAGARAVVDMVMQWVES